MHFFFRTKSGALVARQDFRRSDAAKAVRRVMVAAGKPAPIQYLGACHPVLVPSMFAARPATPQQFRDTRALVHSLIGAA